MRHLWGVMCLVALAFFDVSPAMSEGLPGRYFRLMQAGAAQVKGRLDAEPEADLESLEMQPEWHQFPYAILAPAVLYAKQHPDNPCYKDPGMLQLAVQIGDLLASEDEKGHYEPRLNSDWDTYMWLEAYRLLEPELGEQRRVRWRTRIERNVVPYAEATAEKQDFPWYTGPFLGTATNHFGLYANDLLLAGRVFGNRQWERLGTKVLHRLAIEQTPDGYWGEFIGSMPETGYNYVTMTSVALGWELAKDPAMIKALRRATDFHKHYTYPNGAPVEVIDGRNRHRSAMAWGHFGFSHFPDGRRYAEFLASFFRPESLTVEALGRLSQDALYYHEGPTAPIPQDKPSYEHQLNVPAGIRKTGPWVVCLSGLIETQYVFSQWFLDRQGHLSIFHDRLGLIITGANSKHQPGLATFSELIEGQTFHIPLTSRLQMTAAKDRLSLAYNQFFAELEVSPPTPDEVSFRFWITRRGGPPEQAQLTLQLCLKAGEALETSTGQRIMLGAERIELSAQQIGGSIRHHGWTLKTDPTARLVWPVYPHNPYTNSPETSLEHAVGALSVPLRLTSVRRKWPLGEPPREQEIVFTLRAISPGSADHFHLTEPKPPLSPELSPAIPAGFLRGFSAFALR